MKPTNADDATASRFPNPDDLNSNISFNTPSFSRQGSGLSRPRLVKVRRGFNSQILKPSGTPETGFRPGFNPFRTSLESSSRPSVSGDFGTPKSGSEAKTLGANRGDSNASSGKWDSSGTFGRGVIDEMRSLKIGSGNEGGFSFNARSGLSSSSAARVDNVGFVFRNESIVSKLPEDMRKLNIEDTENVRCVEKGRDKTKSGFGSNDNVGDSLGRNVELELPNELRKLNIKETVQLDRSGDMPNADDVNEFAFGNPKKASYTFSGSSETILLDKMKNLKVKDHADISDRDNPILKSAKIVGDTSDGIKGTFLSEKMEKMSIGTRAGDSTQSDAGTSSHQTFTKNVETGNCGDKLFHNLDKPGPREFPPFQVAMQGENLSGFQFSSVQPKNDAKSCGSTPSRGIHFPPLGGTFEVPAVDRPEKRDEFCFTSKQDGLGAQSVAFKTPNPKPNLFSGANKKLEFGARRKSFRDTKLKKTSGTLRRSTSVQLEPGHDFVSREESSMENVEASESGSPMDVSPYQETLADNQWSKEISAASGESFSLLNNYSATVSVPTVSNDPIDEDLAMAAGLLNIKEVGVTSGETKQNAYECRFHGSVDTEGTLEGSISEVETESFKSAGEEVDFIGENPLTSAVNEASSSSNVERHDTDGEIHFGFPSTSEDRSRSNFTFAASSAAQSQLPASKRIQKKKNLAKAGQDTNVIVPNVKVPYASSSAQFLPYSGASVLMSPGHFQKIDSSIPQRKHGDNSGVCKEQEIKQSVSPSAETTADQEACEKWRLRGNQAYSNGDLSKAEDCYTKGVNCISKTETSRSCLRALMLCYSNRAATRMTLGRMRDALGDCMMAAAIDSNFLRVQVRAANCYLALGEVEDASQHFRRCLQLANDVCVDRKIAVEASDGLQKAQKVSECLNLSAELLQWKISTNAESALELIAEGLVISPSSEKLLEMKAEALFMVRRYEEVIKLCEQTLGSAEKNNPSVDTNFLAASDGSELSKYFYFRLWRSRVVFKSYFHLGKLEEGLASLEKLNEKVSATYRDWRETLEASVPLVVTVRELLSHKAAGNEAFQGGRHTEAVEHYTIALSCNVESRPFTAVCFCNRAAAYKALGQITDAIADCSLAIALDGNYLKAISRRATLYEMIRDYGQAARDLQRLVSILTKQAEEKSNQCGTSERSISCTNDLRQARLRLSEIEDRKNIPLDMYLILGVEPSVSASEIKKAYRKAALRHHPDKAGQFFARSDAGDDGLWREIAEEVHKDADRLFKMIGEAYAILSDPIKRSKYDAEEETRNAQKKRSGSSTSRMPADVQNYPFERSSSRRQWREVWRSYGNSSSRGSEATWSSTYS